MLMLVKVKAAKREKSSLILQTASKKRGRSMTPSVQKQIQITVNYFVRKNKSITS